MRPFDDEGQIYTIEGLASAMILMVILLFIFQSVSVASPQTGMTSNMKLSQNADDVISCLDYVNETYNSTLQVTVDEWDGGLASYANHIDPSEPEMNKLNNLIHPMMNDGTSYNVELVYYDSSNVKHVMPVILNGIPGDNSVVASQIVTVDGYNNPSTFWRTNTQLPQVVEVRLIAWYI